MEQVPRAQALILAGKARALLDGRPNVSCEDVKNVAKSALRHRVLPSFFAESEGLKLHHRSYSEEVSQ